MLLLGRTAKRMRFNMLLPNFDLMKNQEKKEKKIQKKIIQNTRWYTWKKSRRLSKLVMKDKSDKYKSWRAKLYKTEKISNPILIDKRLHWWKHFYSG
jgi:hypothetical protein